MNIDNMDYRRKIWTHCVGPGARDLVGEFLTRYDDYLDIALDTTSHDRCESALRSINSQHRLDMPLAIFVHENFPVSCWEKIVEKFPQALIFILYRRGDTNFDEAQETGPHYIYDKDFEDNPDLLAVGVNTAINNYMHDRGYPWELLA